MNKKQKEISDVIVEIFTNLSFDVKNLYKIKERFNILSSNDYEWSDIEDHIFQIIKKIEKIHD